MKKRVALAITAVALLGVLVGCSASSDTCSPEEREVIETANQLITEKYDVTFDEKDFSYSVGKQINETEFVSLDSKEKQEDEFKNIVSVTALKKSLHEKGEIYSFSVTYNQQTKEVVAIAASIAS